MKDRIFGFAFVFRREIEIIFKDFDLIVVLLLAPVLYAFFYGTIYIQKSEIKVATIVINDDRSTLSQDLIKSINSTQLISVTEVVQDFTAAKDRLFQMDAQAIVYIPANFEKDLKAGKGTDIKIYLNNVKFLSSNDINKAFNEVVGTYSAGIKLKYYQSQGYSFEQAKEMIEPVQAEVRSLFNTSESYGDFFLPALLALILQQTLLIGLAESISKEREEKTLKDLYNSANKSILAAINGKAAIYLLLFSVYAFFFYTVHYSLYKINLTGNIPALTFLTLIFLLVIIYLSIFVASFFKRKIISLQFFAFTSVPVFLICGVPWPIQTMPWLLRQLALLIPTTPYFKAMQRITQMGANFNEVLPEFIHLVILMCVCFIGATWRMKVLVNK